MFAINAVAAPAPAIWSNTPMNEFTDVLLNHAAPLTVVADDECHNFAQVNASLQIDGLAPSRAQLARQLEVASGRLSTDQAIAQALNVATVNAEEEIRAYR